MDTTRKTRGGLRLKLTVLLLGVALLPLGLFATLAYLNGCSSF